MSNGNWITFPEADSSKDNTYFWARQKLHLNELSEKVIIDLCAQSRYVFYLNGECLGQGPAKATDLTCYYDSYDISEKLQKGTNCLALEIHYPGNHFRTCVPGIPAFLCRFTPNTGELTDSGWQVCQDPSRVPSAQEFTFQLGYTVFRDMRKIPCRWQCFEDDFSGWEQGEVISSPNEAQLASRDIAPLTSNSIRPSRLVSCGSVPFVQGDQLTQDFAAIMNSEKQFVDAGIFNRSTGIIKPSTDNLGCYLLYDFEREVYGNIIVKVNAPEGTVLDIAYGELLEDGRLDAFYTFGDWIPKAKTTADGYRFADRHILTEGDNDIEIRLQARGFRYAQLVFRNYDSPVKLNDFVLENRVYPIANEAKFQSDNEYYNQLWKMCDHTVRHCVDDSFIDCPWREQAFWINDFLVANLYYFNLSSDYKLPRHCLELAVDGFKKYGFMPAVYPAGDPLFFPSMPALWTLTLYEYYFYSGDEEGLQNLLPAMDSILEEYDDLALEDGLIPNHDSWWNFIDIGYMDAGVELKGCTSVLNAIVAAAFKCAAELHNDQAQSEVYTKRSCQICATMKSELWDIKNKRFRDSTEPEHGFETFSVHPHSIMLVYDLMPEYNDMFAEALTIPNAIPAEPYFQRFVLEALAKAGKHSEAEKIIEILWKPMVDVNSPTVWELASKGPKAKGTAQSLCHAFSCAPLAYASRIIAGIIPLKPGFEEFTVNPTSWHTKKFECHQPTPHGIIRIKRNNDKIEIFVPDETLAALPDGKKLKSGKHIIKL